MIKNTKDVLNNQERERESVITFECGGDGGGSGGRGGLIFPKRLQYIFPVLSPPTSLYQPPICRNSRPIITGLKWGAALPYREERLNLRWKETKRDGEPKNEEEEDDFEEKQGRGRNARVKACKYPETR